MATKSSTAQSIKTAKKLYKKNPKLFIALAIVVIIVVGAVVGVYITHPEWFEKELPESGELNIYFLDIGQGDCIYIAFPDGKDMLIDCGSESDSSEYEASILSDLSSLVTDGTIDYLFITHPDTDHVSYMDEVIEKYTINNIYLPFVDITNAGSSANSTEIAKFKNGYDEITGKYKKVVVDAYNEGCPVSAIVGNFEIEINDEVEFLVYAIEENEVPSNVNGLSPICLMTYAGRTIVFTGDAIGKDTDDYLQEAPITNCDVLKVAHHGSATNYSNKQDFIESIDVEYAVISVGAGNKYGLPDEEVIDRLLAYDNNMTIYRTDVSGNITLNISNTGEMTFKTEKVV